MIKFILNSQLIETDLPPGITLLDFIRYQQHLRGTKIGCREGDCGACTILVGGLIDGQLQYHSVTSCLMPLQQAAGRHIISVEGINQQALTPVQQAIVDQGGTQCGFCTIGFVMSLTGYMLDESLAEAKNAVAAIDGNICRCTGYKSLERAAEVIAQFKQNKPDEAPLDWLIQSGFLPDYFKNVKERLLALAKNQKSTSPSTNAKIVGGGTDLYVQQPEEMAKTPIVSLRQTALKQIEATEGQISVGGAVTVTELMNSPLMQKHFPHLQQHMKLVSSTPIRNMATLAGNLVNASPIGDMTIFFLALDASLCIAMDEKPPRFVQLRHFYTGYKEMDLKKEEHIESIQFEIPTAHYHFNFEKVCKRTHLDIASVNTACSLIVDLDDSFDQRIVGAHISAGGLAPIPLYLTETSKFLSGKALEVKMVIAAAKIALEEIAPISDARGSAAYKRLLFRQLFFAHFITLFPQHFDLQQLSQADL